MQKRSYTDEFRRQAVALVKELGSYSKAAKQLGISDTNLYAWCNKFEGKSVSPSKPVNQSDLEAELKQLRKENADLKKINIILKQCAAFFSQDQLK